LQSKLASCYLYQGDYEHIVVRTTFGNFTKFTV